MKKMATSNPAAEERTLRRRLLGECIRSLRMQAEMTQDELGMALANTSASDTPVPQTTISRWETGAVELELEQVYAIEEVLKVKHGTISAAAGYSTANVKPESTELAIRTDPTLHPSVRDDFVGAYHSFQRSSRMYFESEERVKRLNGARRASK